METEQHDEGQQGGAPPPPSSAALDPKQRLLAHLAAEAAMDSAALRDDEGSSQGPIHEIQQQQKSQKLSPPTLPLPSSSSPSSSSSSSSASSSTTVRVWVVRHSERADEKGGRTLLARQRSAEKKSGVKLGYSDPPLTNGRGGGLDQSAVMALVLRASIEAGTPVKVFTSPLVRCVQTAAAIGRTLHVPVVPVASLGACALVVRMDGLRNYVDSGG